MKAIDELRKAARKDVHLHTKFASEYQKYVVYIEQSEFDDMIDAIEQELEERFIELPVDADNVPIKVNDEMESVHRPKEVFIVKRLKYSEKHGWMIGGAARDDLSEYGLYAPFNCHHHKPPTVEDEIRSIVQLCFNIKERGERWSVDDVMQSGNVSDVVAKLQLREESE